MSNKVKSEFTLAQMYLNIRNACGILGMILPWLALFSAGIVADKPSPSWWYSISATYYQTPALPMVLTAASLVLMIYHGYSTLDMVITILAGCFGILVVFFPCSVGWIESTAKVGFFQVPMKASAIVHNISACVFFLLLAFNCLFLFTKYDLEKGMTDQKKKRNILYIVCGVGMCVSLVIIPIGQMFAGWWVMIGEILALQFFGIAWLCKGGMFLRDKVEASASNEETSEDTADSEDTSDGDAKASEDSAEEEDAPEEVPAEDSSSKVEETSTDSAEGSEDNAEEASGEGSSDGATSTEADTDAESEHSETSDSEEG